MDALAVSGAQAAVDTRERCVVESAGRSAGSYRGGVTSANLGPRFHDALNYASDHFGGRRRGNTRVPAIAHAMAVCALVLDLMPDEDEAIAALLHDVVEDRGGIDALNHIRDTWGPTVADLVEECSDEIESTDRDWMERKRAALERMTTESPAALRIALADKADNARTLLRALDAEGVALFERHAAGGRESLLWYYDELVAGFERRALDLGTNTGPLLREFEASVRELRRRSEPAPHPLGSGA